MRLRCFYCGKSVSTEVSDDTVVRASLECPECIEKKNNDQCVKDSAPEAESGVIDINECTLKCLQKYAQMPNASFEEICGTINKWSNQPEGLTMEKIQSCVYDWLYNPEIDVWNKNDHKKLAQTIHAAQERKGKSDVA